MSPHLAEHRVRISVTVLLAFVLLAFAAATADAAPAPVSAPGGHRAVFIVLAPYLTWADISPERAPALWSLAEQGAIGNMNSVTADPFGPTVAGGALTLGAGRWAAAPVDTPATAVTLDAARAANARSLAVPRLGALGTAFRAAGGRTIAVGASDESTSRPGGTIRAAELVATDASGTIDLRLTDRALLEPDPASPFGERADAARMRKAVATAIAEVDTLDVPSLLVVDTGDLGRAHDATTDPARAAEWHRSAVARTDAVVGQLRDGLPEGGLLLVVAPATGKPYYEPPHFGPTVVFGDGAGLLSSSSTHRPGIVTNLDLAPTVLAAIETTRPVDMVGSAFFVLSSPSSLTERIAALSRLDSSVGAVDYLRDLHFIRAYSWAVVAIVLLAAAALLVAVPVLSLTSRALLVLALAVPPAAWLMFLVRRYPTSPSSALVAAGAALGLVVAVAGVVAILSKGRPALPLLLLSTLTVLAICIDQWLGHPYETGLFSYSVRAGWRYYGMGNEGAALLVGAALATVGLASDLVASGSVGLWIRRLGAPALGLLVLATAAAPALGANAGVAIWGVLAFTAAWAYANGVRVTWRLAAVVLLAIVVIVSAFALIDMAGAAGGETHLGRFVATAIGGGPGTIWELVYRKAANNIGYLTQTPYSWMALAIGAVLGWAYFAGDRPLAFALAGRRSLAAAVLGCVVGGAAALLTEDSGIVMPALILLAGALPALYLALPCERRARA